MRAYNITAPEEIAKEYGGNKRRIQQAASQGIISPTEAVMAGMFIDRMRNAAAQEQAQQPTVAEQVMNPQPPMPPQGMAAMPQAQQMPPQAQMGAPMQRMAMGGGVDSIPFDEGDYAEGGIVSFRTAGALTKDQMLAQLRQQYLAAGSAQERADVQDKIDNIMKMGTVTSPGGQAVTDSQLNQGSSFTGTAPFATTDLGSTAEVMGGADTVPANRSEIPYVPDETSIITAVEQGKALAQQPSLDRFNTGTLTEEKAMEIAKNQDKGLFGAVPFRKSPLGKSLSGLADLFTDGSRVEKMTDPDTDMLSSSAESLPAPMRSTDLTLPVQQNIISNMTSDQVIANEAARGKTGRGLMDPSLLYMQKAYGDARRGDPFVGKETVVPAQDPSLPNAMTMSGVNTVAEQVKQTEKAAEAVNTPRLTTEQAAASENVNVQELENAGVGAETLTTIGSLADMFNREEGAAAKKYRKYLQDLPKQAGQRKADALAMFALQTGIGMLAQPGGQTVFQAAGKSADKAIKTYAAEMKDIRGLEEKALKGEVALEELQQKRADANLKIAADIYGRQLVADTSLAAARINAGKPTDATRGINRIAASIREKIKSGEYSAMSDAQIEAKAQNDYYAMLAAVQTAKLAKSGITDQVAIMNSINQSASAMAKSRLEAFEKDLKNFKMTGAERDAKYLEFYDEARSKFLAEYAPYMNSLRGQAGSQGDVVEFSAFGN